MELLALTQRVLEIFECDLDGLGSRLMESLEDESKLDAFAALGLGVDLLQKIYQYYLADRKGKKQDFTPQSLAELVDSLAGDCEIYVDLCAGTGALTIQRWTRNRDQKFELYEIDEGVVPYLLFNLVVRNIDATVCVGDVLTDEYSRTYIVAKGERYGRVRVEPAV